MNSKNINDRHNLLLCSLAAVPACQRPDADEDWFPALDIIETEQEYVCEVDLPGLKAEDIQLQVDEAGIRISGKRLPRPSGGKRLRVERPSGTFVRQLPLPQNRNGELHATFGDGVLELRLHKARPDGAPEVPQAAKREPEAQPI